MKNTKRSVTYKMIAGYLLASILAVIAFWVVYTQISRYTQINNINDDNSKKLILVGEAITSLYEAESLTRNIIQTSDIDKFGLYKAKVDSIIKTIDLISLISYDTLQIRKMDSIKLLVDNKNTNFEALISIYKQRKEKGLQQNVIEQLKKSSKEYGNYRDYDTRFAEFDADKRSALKRILELSKKDNAQRLTNQTLDSVANRFYEALERIEKKQQKYEQKIKTKENNLLKNDQIITRQLRDLLEGIELSERKEYNERLAKSRGILDRTSNFIVIITAISLVIAIIFLYLITTDVSRSQKYRVELEEEKSYTESLLNTRESLINTVTHDLRSPLNTVIGYSDLLEKTGLNTRQKHYLEHLKKSSDYILHLVNDLLDLSKLEAGRMMIEQLPFSPKKLIENTLSSVIPLDDKKKLDIRTIIDPALKKQYISDPFRLKQILTNLINNAYKFTDAGSITIKGDITENGLGLKELVISVRDTGIGINKEQQKYIFEEFSQGDENTEKKYGGFGLGLAITKKIIQLLDGKIDLKSEPDKGSNFTFRIPIKMAKSQIIEEEHSALNDIHFSNQKVLIVDDDPSQLSLTSEVSSLAGLSYDTCVNGKEALAMLEKNTYNLVLTDIQMPKMDGFELIKSIKKHPDLKDIPIIALSGRTDKGIKEYEEAGFIGSLRKPYAPNDLINLIAKVLKIDPSSSLTLDADQKETNENDLYSLDDLRLFAQGDPDSLYAILDTFYESTVKNVEELNTTILQNDTETISKLAHKMLPMFKQIKASEVVPILHQLEHPEQYHLSSERMIQLTKDVVAKIEDLIDLLKVEKL